MKRFLLKLCVFLILLFGSATLLQKVIDQQLRKDNSFEYDEWSDIFRFKINATIIFQGNSRAYRHFSTIIMDSAFKTTSYNLGIRGYGFFMEYYRFLIYTGANKLPKYVIQNIDPATLEKTVPLINYTQFLPYLNNETIQEAVSNYTKFNWKDFYIPLFKYYGNYQAACRGLSDIFRKLPDTLKRPDIFPDANWYSAFKHYNMHPQTSRCIVDKRTIHLLTTFLAFCKVNAIRVIFVCTPEYYESQQSTSNRDSVMNIFRNYANQYNIPFLDYSHDSICYDTVNFFNSNHLGSTGVRKFNRKLVNDLKDIIK